MVVSYFMRKIRKILWIGFHRFWVHSGLSCTQFLKKSSFQQNQLSSNLKIYDPWLPYKKPIHWFWEKGKTVILETNSGPYVPILNENFLPVQKYSASEFSWSSIFTQNMRQSKKSVSRKPKKEPFLCPFCNSFVPILGN